MLLVQKENHQMSPQEREMRITLAASFRMFAMLKMDDLIYTHLSARVPDEDAFLINPFGLLFEEITASSLLKVSIHDGHIIDRPDVRYNETGFTTHGIVYQHKKHINSVMHLHSPATVAMSCLQEKLLPLSQFSLQFYNKVSYLDYDGINLHNYQGDGLLESLGDNNVLIMRNHGSLSAAASIQEAFTNLYYLELSCQIQLLAQGSGQPLKLVSPKIAHQVAKDHITHTHPVGVREWEALYRRLNRTDQSYIDI